MSRLRTGVTLYSFTNEWTSGQYDLDALLALVSGEGLGPGVEIVGFQSLRGFPSIRPADAEHLREQISDLNLTATCLSSNIDVAIRAGRLMSVEESTQYLAAQIEAARLLGFPVVRIQMGATAAVIERSLPIAERAGVVLAMEIHAPEHPRSPTMQAVRELYQRLDSPHLGFVPDFSSTMRRLPAGKLQSLRDLGLSEHLVTVLEDLWSRDGAPHARFRAFAQAAQETGAPAAAIHAAQLCFTMFGHADPAEWGDLAGQIPHCHAKFYAVVDGDEPAIDYATNLTALRQARFNGTVSSEWEAHAYLRTGQADPVAQIRAQQTLMHRIWDAEGDRAQSLGNGVGNGPAR